MTTFVDILKSYYDQDPGRNCVYLQQAGEEDQALTYHDLLCGAAAYADTYKREGVEPDEVVVLILQHGLDLIYAFWGAVLYGAIPSIMPFLTEKLSPERYQADLAALISVTRPTAIVTYPNFEPIVQKALREGDSVRKVISKDEVEPKTSPSFGSLPGYKRQSEDIVLLQHSSGTTGLKKGVALSHQAVLNQLDAYAESILLDPGEDLIVSWLPLYHDMGLVACFLLPILKGVPLVLMSPFDWVRAPYRLLQAVSKYGGTLSWLPNFAYNFCAQKIREQHLEGVDLSSWRGLINCSETVQWESHQKFFEAFQGYGLSYQALQTSYAMAENTFGVTQSRMGNEPALDDIKESVFFEEQVAQPADVEAESIRMMSSGQPIRNTEVRVVDEEGNQVKDRVVGEISLRSDCMLTEYYNRPGITEDAFRDGWYLTGDFGYFADGELYVTGRKKDILIVSGKNIYPQDLEELAYEVHGVHPGRAVAFGVFNEQAGTEDVVMVAESEAQEQDKKWELADKIRRHVTKNSPIALRYVKIVGPKWIIKTSSGKASRLANKEKYLREQK
ncbi:MAG: AMP-binding protein [Anaerolineales bacterium]|nr:AMP-binding protein [Anaerolineales bacterium]